MLRYKKRRARLANKQGKLLWYPELSSQRPVVTTRRIARELAARSGATEGDVIGILHDLGLLMREHLSSGSRVVLDGIGWFKLAATAAGNGVETADKVSAKQFNRLKIVFAPEATSSRSLGTKEVTLIARDLIRFVLEQEAEADAEQPAED